MPTCFYHADRETGRSCTRCGRPACPECLHEAPVGSHCWECIKASRPPLTQRVRTWNAMAGAYVTYALIAVNVVVYLLTMSQRATGAGHQDLLTRLSLYGPAVAAGQWYRLVSSGFVHYGLIHIGFNMLLLWQLGSMLESELGRWRFAGLYFASLLCGSFGVLLVSPTALSGGASGAVFGLFGAAAMGLHQRGINVLQINIGVLIVLNLIITFVVPNISIGAHVGGLLGGALCGGVMVRERPSPRATVIGVVLAAALTLLAGFGAVAIAHP